jgi:hypothetical protein
LEHANHYATDAVLEEIYYRSLKYLTKRWR